MKKGLVSIITPCYNGEKFISETIESVLNQTYSDWEMIIIDDGSKDSSASIIEVYSNKDKRIKLLRQSNAGSASARNNGIRHANGQYIALLDADDLWSPLFLKKQIDFMTEKKAVCVYSSYSCIDENSQEIFHPVYAKSIITEKDMLTRNYIGCLTGLYDTSRHGKIYLKEELKSIRDDYAYWLDIVKLEGKAYGNKEILAKYRIVSTSTTAKKWKLIRRQYEFYRQYLKLSVAKSTQNTIKWGLAGLMKYKR